MHVSDVVIAGAGIIGLSAALEFAAHGLTVSVLEQGSAMREASWAAAGMLAEGDPENPPGLRALAAFSRALYPEFLCRIEELSGIAVPLRTRLTLQGLSAAHLSTTRGWEILDAEELRGYVPEVQPGGFSFVAIEEPSLDPRDLCHALPAAVRAAGAAIEEQTTVHGVERSGSEVQVTTSRGEFCARHYVHATGAWAAAPHWTAGVLPVAPRKGQILSVAMPAGAPVLGCVVRTPAIYLVPRGDGRIVIGATVEEAGFDRSITEAATEALLASAAELWPPIRLGVVHERWMGLRPSTPDGLPILSEMPREFGELGSNIPSKAPARLWAATGHFRNGILLAPGTAHLLRQMIFGEATEVDLNAFEAARFAAVDAAVR